MNSIDTSRQIHRLTTRSEYFAAVEAGIKTFEIRRDDRDFQPGDIVVLCELSNDFRHPTTGREIVRRISYVLRETDLRSFLPGCGLAHGWCIFSLEPVGEGTP